MKQYQAIYGVHDGEALFRQEFYCAWEAANVGSILGRYVESAERAGRINETTDYDPAGAPIEISSDIGRRHISAWWFWQPLVGGFNLIDYDEDAGLDAQEWIERLKERIGSRKLARVWLPHDAKARTFAASHSPIEQFMTGFGHDKVGISPETRKQHSINAARSVMKFCNFNRTRCAQGLAALRAWSYEFDEERKQFSKEPVQDWSTDASDAFCEGAKVMQERVIEIKPKPKGELLVGDASRMTLDQLFESTERPRARI
jgi:phage terminase large subunit